MARRYILTARRKAALRKAQLASARKRRKSYRTKVKSARRGYHSRRLVTKDRSKKRAQARAFDTKVASLRQTHGIRGASRRRAKANRIGRATVRNSVIVGSAVAASAPVHTLVAINKGARVAKATPHAAKGFKRGFQQSRARQAAARRNMSRVDFGRATSHRVGPAALPVGKGSRHYTGRRVRGY